MIRFMTAGESHGKALTVVIEGLPAGIPFDADFVNGELARRQQGYGRGKRMQIEKDTIEVLSGVRDGKNIAAPVTLQIVNRDYENWADRMRSERLPDNTPVTAPRPGHADLAGVQKYGFGDIRNVIERASARETAARVAAGALFKLLLKEFGMAVRSQTISVGDVRATNFRRDWEELDTTPLRCRDPKAEKAMMALIDKARKKGDSLGGVAEVIARGVCPGLGSYVHWDRRLDARIAAAAMSIPSVKGVQIGREEIDRIPGKQAQDEITYSPEKGFRRTSNRAGGIEGGVSNGEDIRITLAIKPIPSLAKPLRSVDIRTRQAVEALKERADVCVVPAVGVIGEAMLAYVLADALTEKFGGDSLTDMQTNFQVYRERLKDA